MGGTRNEINYQNKCKADRSLDKKERRVAQE